METTFFPLTRARVFGVICVAVVVVAWPLFLGKFYAVGDMRSVFIPLELFYQQELRAGHLPIWNPDIAWGYPVLASAQIGFFYPPLLLGRLLCPIWFYMPILFVGHLVALGYGMFVFLKRFRVSDFAALFGSLAFMLSQFVWQHTTHLNIMLAIAWFPWQMSMAHRLGNRKTPVRLRDVVRLSFLIGLPFLIGQIQIPALMAAITSIYFVFLRYQNHHRIRVSLGVVSAIAVCSFFVACAQLLPTAELGYHSSRSSTEAFSLERANQHSFPLYHLPAAVFPRFFGNDSTYWGKRLEIEYGFFIGIIPLALALSALSRKHGFFLGLFIASFLLALGGLSPFRLIGFEPSVWIFSAPARWLFFSVFALCFFAARGFDAFRMRGRMMSRIQVGAVCVLVSVLLVNLYLHAFASPEDIVRIAHIEGDYNVAKIYQLFESVKMNGVSIMSAFTWVSLGALAVLAAMRYFPYPRHVFFVAAALELIIIASTTTPVFAWRDVLAAPSTISLLSGDIHDKQARMYSVRDGGDTGAYFTDPASRANEATRKLEHKLLVPLLHAQHGIAGIEWPASLDLQGHEMALRSISSDGSYELQNVSRAEDLNIGAVVAHDGEGIRVQRISSRPRAEVLNVAADVTYAAASPTHTVIAVDTPVEGTLVVRDSYYPGWKATVNGKDIGIERHAEIFRSIPVPSGVSIVEMRYRSTFLSLGLALTILSIVAGFLVLVHPARI